MVVTTFYPNVHTLTVSDLGLPARGGNVSQSTIFRGTFLFSGGHYIFFYSNIPSVMLSTNAMFKSELTIQLLSTSPGVCATSP